MWCTGLTLEEVLLVHIQLLKGSFGGGVEFSSFRQILG